MQQGRHPYIRLFCSDPNAVIIRKNGLDLRFDMNRCNVSPA